MDDATSPSHRPPTRLWVRTATVRRVSTKPFIAARVEEFLDRRFEALFRALGWRELVVIRHTGYGSHDFVRVMARVVLALTVVAQPTQSTAPPKSSSSGAAGAASSPHPAYGCRSRSPWATGR